MLQIHEKIEQARVSAGLTQDEMAEKLGIKRSTYQYWEKKTPSVEKVKEVAKVLNLTDDYFFGTNDEKSTSPETKSDKTMPSTDPEFQKLSMQAITNLTASNKSIASSNESLAKSNEKIAESNASLARSNEELVRMVRSGSTVDAHEQNSSDVAAIRTAVLKMMFEIGSGKRWESPLEAEKAYNTMLFGEVVANGEIGNRSTADM